MATENNNPRPDEGDLLAYVEGVALPAPRQAALTRALAADPALARRLERMRMDREALASLPEISAPASLMDGVEAAIERRMLLGMERDAGEGSIPVSLVRPERRGIWQTFMADRTGRRLAAAAAVLLVVGGVSLTIVHSMSGPSKPEIVSQPLALNSGPAREDAAKPAPTETFKRSDTPAASGAALANKGDDKAVGPAQADPIELANQAPTAPGLSAADAVRLAREHRLVITIRVKDEAQTVARLDRMADRLARSNSGGSWRIAQHVPHDLAVALKRAPLERVPEEPDEMRMASSDASPVRVLESPAIEHLPNSGDITGLYIVESRLDEAALALVAKAFEGTGRTVEFTARDEPLPESALPRDLVLSPASVLWWSRPASEGWVEWTRVPVVVEPAP